MRFDRWALSLVPSVPSSTVGSTEGLQVGRDPGMQVHRLVEGICKCVVGWLSDCVWVGLSVLGDTRGAHTGGFLCLLPLSWIAW